MMNLRDEPLVIIRCITYNHEPYIRQCLDGIVMQKTTFPFFAVVHDDASTDGTASIIREYAEKYTDIIHPIFETQNQYSKHDGSLRRIMDDACKDAKYIAICEGDDYWTDPLKLQKQVVFLEEHPDYSLCCHRYKIFNQNDGIWEDDYIKRLFEDFPDGFSFGNKENFDTWITKTMTLMYRRVCYDSSKFAKYKYCCDEHVNYHLLLKGRGYCLPFVGAVYRRCDTGVFSSLCEIEKTKRWFRIRCELLKFNLTDRDLRDNVYFMIKQYLYNHQTLYREVVYSVPVILKSFYKTEDFGKTLVTAKKIMGSYVKRLKKSF